MNVRESELECRAFADGVRADAQDLKLIIGNDRDGDVGPAGSRRHIADLADTAPLRSEPSAGRARPGLKVEFADEPPDHAVGQTLGRYKLLEKIGEGGSGAVYVAEQTGPVRRRVALILGGD
jgi:hypothetical protein